jgi:hypothetical protein
MMKKPLPWPMLSIWSRKFHFSKDTGKSKNIINKSILEWFSINTNQTVYPLAEQNDQGYGRELSALGMDEFVNKKINSCRFRNRYPYKSTF